MKPANRGEAGFTLFELLVVLTIIVLVTSLALPFATRSSERALFQQQIREVASRLRLARLDAIKRGVETVVAIDLVRRRVTFGNSTVALPPDTGLKVLTARGLTDPGYTMIRFMPRGGSTGGAIDFVRKDVRGSIAISWLTGAVTLQMDRHHEAP